MCLEIKSTNPNKLNKKFKNGKVILYKCVTKSRWSKSLVTQFQLDHVKKGFFYARCPLKQNDLKTRSVIHGGAIHVYTSKKRALHQSDSSYDEVIIPVVCYKKDFLAVGTHGDACFTKIFIRKKDYQKALKATSKSSIVGR